MIIRLVIYYAQSRNKYYERHVHFSYTAKVYSPIKGGGMMGHYIKLTYSNGVDVPDSQGFGTSKEEYEEMARVLESNPRQYRGVTSDLSLQDIEAGLGRRLSDDARRLFGY